MDIFQELEQKMTQDTIEGRIAAELHDVTQQYQEGILTKEDYVTLLQDIEMIEQANDIADDEVLSRWLTETVKVLIAVV